VTDIDPLTCWYSSVKFAVTLSVAEFIVIVVGFAEVLDRSALPDQLENLYPLVAFCVGFAVSVTIVPGT
jgi:uncharacterized protein YebE (UPF0316 family)